MRTAGLKTQLDLTCERRSPSRNCSLRVDEVTGTGRAAVNFGEPAGRRGGAGLRPPGPDAIPATGTCGRSSCAVGKAAGRSAHEDWSDAPIDVPLPLPIDVDLRLRAEGVKAGQLELGAVSARLQADRQQATVTIDELQAYGGRARRECPSKARARHRPMALDLQSQGVRLLAASQALTGKGRFDGGRTWRWRWPQRQQSAPARTAASAATARLVLRDGAVLGINIAGMLRQIMTLGLNPGATQQQRTDFAEAGGSFRIQNGILRNDDLYLRAPVLRLDGAGSVDLPQRTVDYRVTPQLATTLEGQGASGTPVLQAGMPFLVQGPFASPSVRFDLNGTLTSAVSSPADLARVAADLAQNPQAVQVLRDQFDLLDQLPAPAAGKARDLIEGVLGGAGSGSKGGQTQG